MKKLSIMAVTSTALFVCHCQAFDGKKLENHKVTVTDVIQTKNYTYLHVNEENKINWLAVPLMEAKAGETYYYTGAMPMPKWESKELHRTFDTVLFLGGVSKEPITEQSMKSKQEAANKPYKRTSPTIEKIQTKIDVAQGGISIGELFAKKDVNST